MEPTFDEMIRNIVALSISDLVGSVRVLSEKVTALESKLKTYEDAAPINYDGPYLEVTGEDNGKT